MAIITTPKTAAPWSPDTHIFHPGDAVPQALILAHALPGGQIDGDQPAIRVAYVNDDEAQFTAEGNEIPEADPALAEVLVHTAKITQLVRLSNEQFGQVNTAAQLAESVTRALTKKADAAFLAQPAPTPPAVAPSTGLANTTGAVAASAPVAGDLDVLADLLAVLEVNGATPTAIIVDPVGWAELSKLKVGADRNDTLLGAGTAAADRRLLSVPVAVSREMPTRTGLVVDRNAIVAASGGVRIATSEHESFSSDTVMLRATWRIGHTVVRPERLGKFTITSTP